MSRSEGDPDISLSYTIDFENGLIHSVGEGVVTVGDFFGYLRAQTSDPNVPRPLRDLHDLSRVERYEVEPEHIKRLADAIQQDPEYVRDARLAVIAPRDHVYGMYRMLQLLTEHAPAIEALRSQGLAPAMGVFREAEEARDWLLAAEVEPPFPLLTEAS